MMARSVTSMRDKLDGFRGPEGDRSDPFEEQDGSVPWPEGKPVQDWDNTDPAKKQRIDQLEKDNGEALY